MSFILEALKKADAERDRGAVPDLYAQGMLPEAAFEADPDRRGRPWLWLVAGIGLALIAAFAWQWLMPPATPAEPIAASAPPVVTAQTAPTAQTAQTAPAAAAPAAPASTPAAAGEASRPAQLAASEPAAPPPVARAPAAPRTERARPAPKPAAAVARRDAEHADAGPMPKTASKAPPAQHAADAERVPRLTELPDDVRRQVPALKLGGLVYSAAPASRMVLVNGDLQREGSTVAPGLTLERINPKSVIFSLRGQRFEVPI
ncbi:MAG: general secretion pathway protein GspB [Burkholderiaceae bacterium]|nr:general secretion pathway protein GspB [Burkholderiaceae bacterium]